MLTKIKNKRGELTTEEILKLILAAAGIFLLVFLMYKLISPNFNKNDETAKSYLDTLKKEIAKADAGQVGEFNMWQANGHVGIVYFGNKSYFTDSAGHKFFHSSSQNTICACVVGTATCKECINLNHNLNRKNETLEAPPWVLLTGQKFFIVKQWDEYWVLNSLNEIESFKRLALTKVTIPVSIGMSSKIIYNDPLITGCNLYYSSYVQGEEVTYYLENGKLMQQNQPPKDVDNLVSSNNLYSQIKGALIKNCPKDAK